MIGGYSKVAQHIPPYMLVAGNPAYVHGVNIIGARRLGLTSKELKQLKDAQKALYRSSLNVKQALTEIAKQAISRHTKRLVIFIKNHSDRGISKKKASEETVDI